ncbi:MAG: 50S ribosomal protein L32 [Dehalococcoidia bacterium]|nr:50S ribosomal protein L32 [Dehalococcoidia bacterium]MDW8120246.1 50S ribosomal protein L32 [Chloroflexota bacterium]
MPPLPKKQLSKSKQRKRAAHYRFRAMAVVPCPQCRRPRLAHHVCPFCGTYKGRKVLQGEHQQ